MNLSGKAGAPKAVTQNFHPPLDGQMKMTWAQADNGEHENVGAYLLDLLLPFHQSTGSNCKHKKKKNHGFSPPPSPLSNKGTLSWRRRQDIDESSRKSRRP